MASGPWTEGPGAGRAGSEGPWTAGAGRAGAGRAGESKVWVAPGGSGHPGGGGGDSTRLWGWIVGLTVWVAEIVLAGYLTFIVGALSVMMTANCMPDSTERHCTSWMGLMLFGPLASVVVTALVMGVILAFKRNFATLGVALVVTAVVPFIATVGIAEFVLGDMGFRF